MISELDAQVDHLNSEGAQLFQNSKYDEAEALVHKGRALADFISQVVSLREVWMEAFASSFPVEVVPDAVESATRTILSSSKSSKTTLLVRFRDGTVISEPKAAETFALTLKKIGFDRVQALHKVVNNEEMISNTPSRKYNDTMIDGLYVKTHSSTSAKKRQLEDISSALNCGLSIQIVN
ncbi:hypothetical protein [Mameliella alba]|nr:hypothetical protein [Mameliella alba]